MEALRAITTDLTSGIKHLKRNKKSEGRAAFGAIKSLAFGETVKEKRLTSTVSKLVSLDRRSVSRGIKRRCEVLKGDEPSWPLTKRRGCNALWVKTKNADLAKKRSIISSFASNNDLL